MYTIEVQNRETKEWDTLVEGEAKSRRAFLKGFDRLKVTKKQWRCRKVV